MKVEGLMLLMLLPMNGLVFTCILIIGDIMRQKGRDKDLGSTAAAAAAAAASNNVHSVYDATHCIGATRVAGDGGS